MRFLVRLLNPRSDVSPVGRVAKSRPPRVPRLFQPILFRCVVFFTLCGFLGRRRVEFEVKLFVESIEKRLRGLFTAQYADRDVTLVGVKRIYTLLQDGKLYTCFALTLDGTEIYRAALTAATDGAGQLLSLSGDGYLLPLERRVFSQQTDQLNILATELQAHKTSGAGTRTVASVSECYVPSLSSDGTLLRFLPAWKITYTDHGESVYDTVNKGKYVIP